MPRGRFRLRTLMIAVAVVALLAFGVTLIRNARRYRRTAVHHAIVSRIIEIEAGRAPTQSDRERAAYHSKLNDKYEHAASRPWLPLPPDPPPPE